MITPRIPNSSASSPDDDPTGVRALLSGLPEPEPMPAYLVARIGASLAAEQAQRAAEWSGASVSPLLAPARRRAGRVLFAITGAAAAVALFGVVGNSMLQNGQNSAARDSAAAAVTSGDRAAEGFAPPSANDKAAPGLASKPGVIQIRSSQTRYTSTDFATQAANLRTVAPQRLQDQFADAGVGPIGTEAGLTDCLRAIGAGEAQTVRADVAFYEGQPAVIIVATVNGIPMAYAVSRDCSLANPGYLHPAILLP